MGARELGYRHGLRREENGQTGHACAFNARIRPSAQCQTLGSALLGNVEACVLAWLGLHAVGFLERSACRAQDGEDAGVLGQETGRDAGGSWVQLSEIWAMDVDAA